MQLTLRLDTGADASLCVFDNHVVAADALAAWPVEVAPVDATVLFENVASMKAADKATMELWLGLPGHVRCAHKADGLQALRKRIDFATRAPVASSRASVSRLCERLGVLPFALSDHPAFLGPPPTSLRCITGSAYLGAPKLQAENRRVQAALRSGALPAGEPGPRVWRGGGAWSRAWHRLG